MLKTAMNEPSETWSMLGAIADAYRRAPENDPLEIFQRKMADDCVFEDWVGDVRIDGAERIRQEVYRPYAASYRDCSYDVEAVVNDGRRLVVSGVFHGWKRRAAGDEVKLSWKFRDLYVARDAEITLFSVASDTLEVDRLLGGEPA